MTTLHARHHPPPLAVDVAADVDAASAALEATGSAVDAAATVATVARLVVLAALPAALRVELAAA